MRMGVRYDPDERYLRQLPQRAAGEDFWRQQNTGAV